MIYNVNILKFVAAHGAVDQPACINIVFVCKEAQQCDRTHQLGFIRPDSWSAQNSEPHWSHVHITLTVEHFSFHAFFKKCGSQRDFDVLFKSLNVTKTINIFLAHFRFSKKQQVFLNAAGHNACCPTTTKISIDILLPVAISARSLSLRAFSYLCAHLAISARVNYLCAEIAISARI